MPVCATCHTDGQTAGSACRFCGAWVGGVAGDEVEPARASVPNMRAASPSFPAALEIQQPMELPPLELEMPRRTSASNMQAASPIGAGHGHPSQQAPKPSAAPVAPARSLTVPTSPDLDFDSGGAMLELDIQPTSAKAPPSNLSNMMMDSGPGSMGGGLGSGPISSSSGLPSSPSLRDVSSSGGARGRGPLGGPSESLIDDEAISLAAYGNAPEKIWETPLYAYRVYRRQSELRGELEQREQDYKNAKKEAEEALVALGHRGRAAGAKLPQYKAPLDSIAAAESLLRSRDSQLMAAMDVHNKKLAELDKRTQELEALLSRTFAEQKAIEIELGRAQEQVARMDAQDEANRRAQLAQAAANSNPGAGKR